MLRAPLPALRDTTLTHPTSLPGSLQRQPTQDAHAILTIGGDWTLQHYATLRREIERTRRQITEFVPPSRIFDQLSSFVHRARSTSIFVLNLSDLKPAVLSAAAALKFVWDPAPYM